MEFLDIIFWCLSFLGAVNIIISNDTISLIRNLVTGQPLKYEVYISIGIVVSIGIIIAAAFIIVDVILKKPFNIGKKKSAIKVTSFFLGVGIMAVFLFVAWAGRATLFTVNIFAACIFVLMLYIAHIILSRI